MRIDSQWERERKSMIALFGKGVQFQFFTDRQVLLLIRQFDTHAKLVAIRIGDFDCLMNLSGLLGRNRRVARWEQFQVERLE